MWIVVIVTTLAYAALGRVKLFRQGSVHRIQLARALFTVHTAAMLAHSTSFSQPRFEKTVNDQRLEAERRWSADGRIAVLSCKVTAPRFESRFDIEWEKVGAEWRVRAWREVS